MIRVILKWSTLSFGLALAIPSFASDEHSALAENTPAPESAKSAETSPDKAAPASEHAPAQPAAEQGQSHAETSVERKPEYRHTSATATETSQLHATSEEIDSLIRIGLQKIEQKDYHSAELALQKVLSEQATPEQDRKALIGLARMYRKKSDFIKAAAIYERMIKDQPEDPMLPTFYLELGRTQRALGAYKQAIARFYSVINTTLKLPEEGPEHYRQLARTAQFEIAETYFQAGDYEQANRFFSRLKLLDMAPEDRARAHFKSVYAIALQGDYEKAVPEIRLFIEQNPDDENVPEARYLLSMSLHRLGRKAESLQATLDLLRAEQARVTKDPRRWSYWQRKTGNQLANELYEQGDVTGALTIYQSLVKLSNDTAWVLPATYQIGLCQERLQLFERARESYQLIIDRAKPDASGKNVRPELSDLAEMATWRLNQLNWEQTTHRQLSEIFHQQNPPAALRVANAENHDTHGSTPESPGTVR